MRQSPKTYNDIAGQKAGRLEALSDGVFAIALTLLVLELHVPVIESIHSEGAVLTALYALAPKLLAYFLSFMTLGIFWVGHSAQFNYIDKSDRNLTWLTLFFLLFVSLIPFSTAFLGEYFDSKAAVGLYWLNIFALGATLFVHWNYAYRHRLSHIPPAERESINRSVRGRILIAQALYAGAALLAFINTYLAIGLIILIQLNYALGLIPRSHSNPAQDESDESA